MVSDAFQKMDEEEQLCNIQQDFKDIFEVPMHDENSIDAGWNLNKSQKRITKQEAEPAITIMGNLKKKRNRINNNWLRV